MVAQLRDISVHPNGRRYSEADRESAYVAWRLNSGRSIRKAAEITGISTSTIATWHQDHNWRERADREEDDEAKSIRKSIRNLVTADLELAYKVAREIMLNKENSPRDRMDAVKWIGGLGGMAPVVKSEVAWTNQPASDADDQERSTIESLVGKSPDELMRLEQEAKRRRSSTAA